MRDELEEKLEEYDTHFIGENIITSINRQRKNPDKELSQKQVNVVQEKFNDPRPAKKIAFEDYVRRETVATLDQDINIFHEHVDFIRDIYLNSVKEGFVPSDSQFNIILQRVSHYSKQLAEHNPRLTYFIAHMYRDADFVDEDDWDPLKTEERAIKQMSDAKIGKAKAELREHGYEVK